TLGIVPMHHNPQVGANLQDHLQVRTVYRSTQRNTFNDDMRSPLRMARVGLDYALRRKGPLTVSAGYAGGFFRSTRATDSRPDVQVHFITFSTDKMGDRLHPFSAFTASVCPLRPNSRGHVRICAPDAAIAPEILVNFLSTGKDRADVVAALELVRDIIRQPAMAPFVSSEQLPGAGISDVAQLLDYAMETGGSIYHPSCTAAMGHVVDASLRVMGIEGLRVVDASIMPAVVSGNTNAAVIAIAEKGADLIRRSA
ncbi:GMC oxidoreductase, partial [uncultured Sphingomonas sp.]|uniref:GMC family oxidoreductase n=1 Tax=uncultured Sphingomonas sp. TaxID=158754 RepID=UPI0025EA062B